jgi:predicted Zn finger-like uncharacterized protein
MAGRVFQDTSDKIDKGMKNFYPGSGTTLCPHCDTRFKITEAQLDAPNGMVRCGFCKRVFDARPNFISDLPDPQLELPMLDEPVGVDPHTIAILQPMTLAEQIVIVQNEELVESQPRRLVWLWLTGILLLLLVLLAQSAYFFRVDLATRLPSLKPALVGYCKLLDCTVPLPQQTELLSIESSGLEADPENEDQIILNALLRNRALFAQAFPSLELTLNDAQDQPIARRVFRPTDYLPPSENENAGLLPNKEINLKLHLNTSSLKPIGYRLMLVSSRN